MTRTAPHPEHARAERLRADFLAEHGAREIRWSGHNLSRLLRATGERPARIAEMRLILGALGLGHDPHWPSYSSGVFDHGLMVGRAGRPWAIVGAPYNINAEQRGWLAELARFGTLRVSVDTRESLYGWGTRFVMVELVEPRTPWGKIPATHRTKAAARLARRAFVEEGLPAITTPRPEPRYRRRYW